MMQQQFWNHVWDKNELFIVDPTSYIRRANSTEAHLLRLVGDIRGKRVLEIGCGTGDISICVAKMGAHVTAIDTSESAVASVRALAAYNGVGDRVVAGVLGAMDLPKLASRFDLIIGRFILHHIEPFETFASVLSAAMEPSGRGVFYENNARNPILMFCRKHVAGRFGIPKYGDNDEYPLESSEIAMLQKRFCQVRLHFPTFVFFRQFNNYVIRQNPRLQFAVNGLERLDRAVEARWPALHAYGYHQIVDVSRPRD